MNIENFDSLNCLIDLHLHLDGAIYLESLKKLAKMQSIDLGLTDEQIIEKHYAKNRCEDLAEFLAKFDLPCSLIQTYDSLKQACIDLIDNLKSQGVMYAEIRYAPQFLTSKGMSQEDTIKALIEAKDETKYNCNFILCCIRNIDAKTQNIETVNLAKKYLGKGVCAIDLAGDEKKYTFDDFAYIFDLANQEHIPYTLHAGEGANSYSVLKSLMFNPKRIGHGVRSYENDELLKELAKRNVILELCPTSNIKTNIFDSISQFPYKKFIDNNVKITINSDDPAIELTTIKDEYRIIIDEFGLNNDDLKQLLLNSVEASFVDVDTKNRMIEEINKEL